MKSTTANSNVPRIIRKMNTENLPENGPISTETIRPRSTGMVIKLLGERNENRDVKTSINQNSTRSGQSC